MREKGPVSHQAAAAPLPAPAPNRAPPSPEICQWRSSGWEEGLKRGAESPRSRRGSEQGRRRGWWGREKEGGETKRRG
jgi:hypothetical protein